MSTRSGKRIHASSDSPLVNADITVHSERKTRSKKQKENIELTVSKRHNYVSYPADDDTASVSSDATETHERVRKTRRNTLKEHNTQTVLEGLDLNHLNNTVRKSRRGKKVIEEAKNVGDVLNVQNHANTEPVASEKKRNKKKKSHQKDSVETADSQDVKNHVSNKKGIKNKSKGLNSVLNDQEKEHMNPDIHDTSDSFHSAAGSPVNVNYIENDGQMEVALNIVGLKSKDCSHIIDIKLSGLPSTSKSKNVVKKKKRKIARKGMNNSDQNIDNQNTTIGRLLDETMTSNTMLEIATTKKRKSTITDSTLDNIVKNTSEKKFNSTFNKSSDSIITSNTMSERETKKKRKSSIKDSNVSGIETNTNEPKLNTTFDKSPNVTITSNASAKIATNKNRKSSYKDSTFHKIEKGANDEMLNTTFDKSPHETIISNKISEIATKKKRKSIFKDSFDEKEIDTNKDNLNTSFDRAAPPTAPYITEDNSSRKRKRFAVKNCTIDNITTNDLDEDNLNATFNKTANRLSYPLQSTIDVSTKKRRKFSLKNSSLGNFERNESDLANGKSFNSIPNNTTTASNAANGCFTENDIKSNISRTFIALPDSVNHNDSSHKTSNTSSTSSVINTTYDKIEKDSDCNEVKDVNTTFNKDNTDIQTSSVSNKSHSRKNSLVNNKTLSDSEQTLTCNGEAASESNSEIKNLNSTFDKDNNIQLNTTLETEKQLEALADSKKSSLISSDATINVTFDKSEDSSRISITSDESKTENILNHTPVLIESSIDESLMSEDKSPVTPDIPVTPIKREGTFTKEVSDNVMSPKLKESAEKTPGRRKSSPGCTPFPFSKSSQKENAKLNVTQSIEKSLRRSSLAEVAPRQTRVMFCSPANNPAVVAQLKGRVIKSNLKGSNKSFVFDDSVTSEARAVRRKRSLTLGAVGTAGAETRSKRKRLGDELQHSVDRLSRPRTQSAAAKLSEPGTPGKANPESKVSRTKLPNFAALHQKQFARMESLDECQRRRARRARQLLTPTGSVGLIERISPKETPPKPAPVTKEAGTKHQHTTPSKPKLPTLDSLIPRYNRFGFKLDVDDNPFSVGRGEARGDRGEVRGDRGARKTCLPSLAGATSRREAARQTIMREKSFSEKRSTKRNEARTVIKGVRTNRRFELQMKMRNVNL